MFAKFLLPAVAAFSVAAAQSASGCSQPTATVNSAADATALSSCSTVKGSILIGPDASGTIALEGIQQVTGDVICADAGALTTLSSSTIGTIGGSFKLTNLTILSTLNFGSLTSASTILFQALPALTQLQFASTVSQAKSVTISNTFLETLNGINLNTVGTLQIDNNNRLKSFSTQVANITQSLTINSNGNSLAVDLPNLIWAANATFRNISSIKIPSLSVINGSLGFNGNFMTEILAPNLTAVGSTASGIGSLSIIANSKLSNISFPLLKTIGGANQIANNTNLHEISFPALTYVGGAVDFSGNFTTPQLPALTNVKGGFNVQSQQTIDCSVFTSLASSGVIQGKPKCVSAATTVGGLGSTGTGSNGASSTSKAAAVSYGVNEAVAGLSVLGGLFQMLL